MAKSIAAAVAGLFEIANYFLGDDWAWSHITEKEIGVLISAILPFLIWFVPNKRE